MEDKCGTSSKMLGKEREVDDEGSESENDNVGVGRSYECSFCKRGFTNAQALGGHMNIHRKDKAKVRQQQHQQQQQPISYFHGVPSSTSSISSPFAGYNPNPNHHGFSLQRKWQVPDCFFSTPNNEDYLGSNLSLRMMSSSCSSSNEQDKEENNNNNNNKKKGGEGYDEIDLELRLGYDR